MTDDPNDDAPTNHALDQRIDGLEGVLGAFRERIDELEQENEELRGRVEDTRQELEETKNDLERFRQWRDDVEARVSTVTGVDSEEQSTAELRRKDLRTALINRAKTNNGKSSMYYKEIEEVYADNGHGKVSREQIFRDMEAVEKGDGFDIDTKHSRKGNKVKAIRLNGDELPVPLACNSVTTRETATPSDQTDLNGGENNQG